MKSSLKLYNTLLHTLLHCQTPPFASFWWGLSYSGRQHVSQLFLLTHMVFASVSGSKEIMISVESCHQRYHIQGRSKGLMELTCCCRFITSDVLTMENGKVTCSLLLSLHQWKSCAAVLYFI